MSVYGSAELRAVGGRAGLENEREDVGVEGENKGSLHMVEMRKSLIMAASVDMRSQKLSERKQA